MERIVLWDWANTRPNAEACHHLRKLAESLFIADLTDKENLNMGS